MASSNVSSSILLRSGAAGVEETGVVAGGVATSRVWFRGLLSAECALPAIQVQQDSWPLGHEAPCTTLMSTRICSSKAVQQQHQEEAVVHASCFSL